MKTVAPGLRPRLARQRLIVFLKAPRVGTVKTRLAATLGVEAATHAYELLVNTLLENISSIASAELHFSPPETRTEILHWARPTWTTRPQGEGDLGARMHAAFVNAFGAGAEQVVLIGSDCPGIQADDITTAWARLTEFDVVLGPASDGGYWLIGLRQPHPALFHDLPWSTSAVLDQTLLRASQAGLRTALLRELRDVDTEEDWRTFLRNQA